MVRPLTQQDADILAKLHIENLRTRLRGRFANRLLACYYRTVARGQGGFGYVTVGPEQNVVGYVCGIYDFNQILRYMWAREWPQLMFWGAAYLIQNPEMLSDVSRRLFRCFARSPECKKLEPGSNEVELRPIVVVPEQRGTGVAQALCNALMNEAARRGFASVYLFVEVGNSRANNFYRKVGFVNEDTRNGYNRYRIRL